MRDLSQAMDALLAGVVVVDAGGVVREVNSEACRILDGSAETMRWHRVEDVLDPSLAKLVREVLAKGPSVVDGELTLPRKRGADLTLEVAAAPFFGDGPDLDGVVLELRDRSIHRVLHDVVNEQARMSSFGRIAAGIAHEVKNPLGGIRGAGEIIAKRSEDPKLRQAAELVIRESDRIVDLLDEFMVLGKQESLRLRAVNVHEVLDDVLDLYDMDPLSEQVQVERAFDPSIPEFLADHDRLVQVFHNLVRNALQAMEGSDGNLTITTRIALDHHLVSESGERLPAVLVKVSDSGPGVAEEVRDKLTVPFFTTRTAGTGLGLTITQHFVTAHGGRMTIDSEPGHGTTVRVALPLRRIP